MCSPVAGIIVPLAQVPDPVFAQEMLGPGVAVQVGDSPRLSESRPIKVFSPVSGSVAAIKPHAFVVKTDQGFSVLTHLGVDTVYQDSAQFAPCAPAHSGARAWEPGDQISVGDPVVRWTPSVSPVEGPSANTTPAEINPVAAGTTEADAAASDTTKGNLHPAFSSECGQRNPLIMVTVLELQEGSHPDHVAADRTVVNVGSPLFRINS